MRTVGFSFLNIIIFFISTISFAGQSPLPAGTYRGFNTAEYQHGEIEITVDDDGKATMTAADGKRLLIGDTDLNDLVPAPPIAHADAVVEDRLRRTYAIFHPETNPSPLFLVRHYLVAGAPPDDIKYSLKDLSAPAILIYPKGKYEDNADTILIYSPRQVTGHLFDQAIAEHERVDGGGTLPRIKTGGRSFMACLKAFSTEGRPPN